ncbi:MAG: flagellin [Gemmobacter sp.]
MTHISLGDMAQAFALRRDTGGLKAEIRRFSTEVTTGRAADSARAVSGDLAPLAAIETSLIRATGFRAVTSGAALLAAGMQRVLEHVDGRATALSSGLLRASTLGDPTSIAAIAAEGAQAFDTAVSALNTRLGDRTLFAGQATGGAAIAGSAAILDAVAAAASGAVTAAEVETAVRGWFNDPAGFAALAYRGGNPLDPVPVTPEDRVEIRVTAADPALRDTLAGLAMAALLERGLPSPDPQARADLARRAGVHLAATATDRAGLAARIGAAEARIETAAQRNAAETSALEIARAGLLAVDDYTAATRLEAAQTRLETLYAVTARMSRLSLVDFLR